VQRAAETPSSQLDETAPMPGGPSGGCKEAVFVKSLPPLEHEVERAAELVGENRKGLALAVLAGEALDMALGARRLAKEKNGRLGERPLEMGVADLSSTRAFSLTGGLVSRGYKPGVGAEVLDTGEAADVVDLVEEGQREDLADPWDGAKAVEGMGVVDLGGADEMELDLGEELVVDINEVHIHLDHGTHAGVFEAIGHIDAVGGISELFAKRGQIVLGVGVLDVGQELGAAAHEVVAAPKEIASRAHLGGVDVGLGKGATPEEMGDLEGVDAIVLGLGAVDGAHVEGVTENEGEVFSGAQIADPVPGEHALHGNGHVRAKGVEDPQEGLWRSWDLPVEAHLTGVVEDADIETPGMEIDAAVEVMLSQVETHGLLLGERV